MNIAIYFHNLLFVMFAMCALIMGASSAALADITQDKILDSSIAELTNYPV